MVAEDGLGGGIMAWVNRTMVLETSWSLEISQEGVKSRIKEREQRFSHHTRGFCKLGKDIYPKKIKIFL